MIVHLLCPQECPKKIWFFFLNIIFEEYKTDNSDSNSTIDIAQLDLDVTDVINEVEEKHPASKDQDLL